MEKKSLVGWTSGETHKAIFWWYDPIFESWVLKTFITKRQHKRQGITKKVRVTIEEVK